MPDIDRPPTQVNFDYIKSPQFRTAHIDGGIGGTTPSGFVHIALYSERPAIPQRVIHNVDADGQLGAQISDLTVSRGGIVRELELDVIMTPDTAERLGQWLLTRASEMRQKPAKTT